jgi:hypothetical protein
MEKVINVQVVPSRISYTAAHNLQVPYCMVFGNDLEVRIGVEGWCRENTKIPTHQQ